jgi:hypothetical protein
MHRLFVRLAVVLSLSLASVLAADAPKEKSPGDLAAEAFFKIRDDKDAALDGKRVLQLQQTGLDFLAAYPTHARAGAVITALANFGSTIKDKKQLSIRDYWGTQLNYEILNRRTKSDVTDEVRLVLASLDAAYAGFEVKNGGSREKLDNFRAKIDRLAELEGSSRFLSGHEREYVQVLYSANAKLGEAYAVKLAASSDKRLAAVGREELNLIELRTQPLELKAPTLDGKGFDATALRGKVIYFMFWSSTNEASVKEIDVQKGDYKQLQKVGVEIVTVAQDTDRAALEKFVKSKGYAWPVIFDEQGNKGEFSQQLNVRNLPASALFNQQGTLVRTGVRSNQLAPEVVKLGIKGK